MVENFAGGIKIQLCAVPLPYQVTHKVSQLKGHDICTNAHLSKPDIQPKQAVFRSKETKAGNAPCSLTASAQTMKLQTLLDELSPFGARLIAVSKTQPLSAILSLYEQGQRDFAENRDQALVERYEHLPKDIRWHLIGHLQTNNVKHIAPFVHCIHSVDSLKLLQEIDRQAARCNRSIYGLLQLKIAREESKYGLSLPEAEALIAACPEPDHLQIIGLMGMATLTDDPQQVSREFAQLQAHFVYLKDKYYATDPAFSELSMGMSGDYPLALQAGSTMVRIGSLLFS